MKGRRKEATRLGQISEGGGNDLLAEGEACQRNQLQICHAQGDADDGDHQEQSGEEVH